MGWHCRLSARGNIVNRGSASVDNAFREGDNLLCHPVKNVIFTLLYRMSHFYNKFNRREIFPRDIQNCHPANWPIRLLEINMRYNNTFDQSHDIPLCHGQQLRDISSRSNLIGRSYGLDKNLCISLFMIQMCVITLIQGHISKVNVTVNSAKIRVRTIPPFTMLDLSDISLNFCPWPLALSWHWPKVIS